MTSSRGVGEPARAFGFGDDEEPTLPLNVVASSAGRPGRNDDQPAEWLLPHEIEAQRLRTETYRQKRQGLVKTAFVIAAAALVAATGGWGAAELAANSGSNTAHDQGGRTTDARPSPTTTRATVDPTVTKNVSSTATSTVGASATSMPESQPPTPTPKAPVATGAQPEGVEVGFTDPADNMPYQPGDTAYVVCKYSTAAGEEYRLADTGTQIPSDDFGDSNDPNLPRC